MPGRKKSKSQQNNGVIAIHGAREHNLKNISLEVPRGKFVVITGVSGSGKSTLAFDLLFAEGQRRFLDSMNTYARQFVEQMARPDVDLIDGLPPTVSIEQRTSRGGGKSTVATVTEIYQFLRLLYARAGTQYCPDCDIPVTAQTPDRLARAMEDELTRRGDLLLLAPVVKNRKGFHTDVAEWAAKHGYAEIRADGKFLSTSERLRLDRFREHDIEVVIGVLEAPRKKSAKRPANAPEPAEKRWTIDEALRLGNGVLFALDNSGRETVHSTRRNCASCGASFAPLDPKNFSYNSSQGWCTECRGFGELFYLPDVERGARADAIEESWWNWQDGKREPCPSCNGMRLNRQARSVRLDFSDDAKPSGKKRKADALDEKVTIDFFASANVVQALEFFQRLKPAGHYAEVVTDILPELRERLHFLREVGLDYLQLGRSVTTLSGGEAQRIRLAAQLGSNLSGVLYVLDEPTIGLHPRDNRQLLKALSLLKDRGNTLIVVEHDEDTMRQADWIIDLGPGAGVEGGEVVASGTLDHLRKHPSSITGRGLAHLESKLYPTRGQRRPVVRQDLSRGKRNADKAVANEWLTLHHANTNNLKDVTVSFPLNRFIVVTGVSGSGKSTLVRECLLPAMQHALSKARGKSKASAKDAARTHVTGFERFKAVHEVDQSPIGRTPRSTPATYVGFFDDIRNLFAQTPEARMRGYASGRFSFNSPQGRCSECNGAGTIKVEMNFLPPAYVKCETCHGSRFTPETLDVEFRGKNIAQVLELSIAEAKEFFAAQKRIHRPLEALSDTGLDYLQIGQTSPTLSGGEAQRVKLVTHLLGGLKEAPEKLPARDANRPGKPAASLFILEEPTIGLHMADVHRLVEMIQRLVDAGHTVIVIEHNLDLIGEADWVIDLGPEGGAGGGGVVVEGTPEDVAACVESHTGAHLKPVLRC